MILIGATTCQSRHFQTSQKAKIMQNPSFSYLGPGPIIWIQLYTMIERKNLLYPHTPYRRMEDYAPRRLRED